MSTLQEKLPPSVHESASSIAKGIPLDYSCKASTTRQDELQEFDAKNVTMWSQRCFNGSVTHRAQFEDVIAGGRTAEVALARLERAWVAKQNIERTMRAKQKENQK